MNLQEGLVAELNRNRELKELYDGIPEGTFGSTMIQMNIEQGEKALASGDVVEMVKAFKELQENK